MTEFREKYINPFTDCGFMRLFGEEPEKLKENIFLKLFETAEIAKFSQSEYQEYEDSLKYYRDIKNSLDTAKEEGKIEGKIEVARTGLKEGLSVEIIMKLTGMTKEEIEKLKD